VEISAAINANEATRKEPKPNSSGRCRRCQLYDLPVGPRGQAERIGRGLTRLGRRACVPKSGRPGSHCQTEGHDPSVVEGITVSKNGRIHGKLRGRPIQTAWGVIDPSLHIRSDRTGKVKKYRGSSFAENEGRARHRSPGNGVADYPTQKAIHETVANMGFTARCPRHSNGGTI